MFAWLIRFVGTAVNAESSNSFLLHGLLAPRTLFFLLILFIFSFNILRLQIFFHYIDVVVVYWCILYWTLILNRLHHHLIALLLLLLAGWLL